MQCGLHQILCYTKAESLGLECLNSSGKMLYNVNSPQATVSGSIVLVAVTPINNISTFYGKN